VAQLPVHSEAVTAFPPPEAGGRAFGSVGSPIGELTGMLIRNRWLILLCTVAVTAGAGFFTVRMTPVYSASASLRLDEKESSLPDIFKSVGQKGAVETETQILRSRSLSEEATDSLALQLQLVLPRRVPRSQLFRDIKVPAAAIEGEYRLTQLPGGRFDLTDQTDTAKQHLAYVSPGGKVLAGGASFILSPDAGQYPQIDFAVDSRASTASGVASALTVSQPNRDAQVINLQYEDTDPELVWQVPNAIVSRYFARRQEARRSDAHTMALFLQDQIGRVATQLAAAEDTFRDYRERAQVIAPDVEASTQVTRLITKQSDRSAIDAERQALAQSLNEVTQAAASQKPGDPSPYRKLIGLPFLLRNQAAAQLLSSLAAVEDQRTSLLLRRTPEDADVKVLDTRINEIEAQLYGIATTYLRGLENQVASLDTALQGFDRQLQTLPRKQVEFARLNRKAKGFEEVYDLLQTRLKEAQIAEAAGDASVEVVDTAVAPLHPSRPRPEVNLLGGFITGLLLGLAAGFARERLDRSVHTRNDVLSMTGLPVLGLIPHVANGRGRIALITQERKPSIEPQRVSVGSASAPRSRYTFLGRGEPGSSKNGHTHPGGALATRSSLQLIVANPGNVIAESYGILQTNLAFARHDRPIKTLVLTSPLSGDGKTTNAVNLALTVTERGLRTLLIDADMRRGAVHAALSARREPGLYQVLSGAITLEAALQRVTVGETRSLDFLTSGRSEQSPTPLLESGAMRALLDSVQREYDLVIIDTPPVNIVTDAAVLGTFVDGVLVVARAGRTDRAALSYAVQQLRHVRAPILGVLLNDIDFRRDASYDGVYRYYDDRQYQDLSEKSS
jgi:polysaccharide biosynthesis transport protein